MKQNMLMPKEHFEAIAAQLGSNEALKAARRTELRPKHETPKVIEQRAGYQASMKVLEEHGMRPITYREAFVHIMNNPGLKEQLKGKWFYLAVQDFKAKGLHKIERKGNLTPGWETPENTVFIYSGNTLSAVAIYSDTNTSAFGYRFDLYKARPPSQTAPLVLGIR